MARKRVDSISELKDVYYVYGDEELLVENAIKRLQGLLSSEVDADFNMELLNAPEVGVERIIDSAETMPLMSDRRLVVVRDINLLSRKQQETLVSYLDRPNPATALVLVAHVKPAGQTQDAGAIKKVEATPLFKKVKETGETLRFSIGRSREQKVAEWVTEQFSRRGKRIETVARELLLQKAGSDLRDLESAVERICLFAADDEVIGPGVVAEIVVPTAEQGVFELVDAVADRRRDISLYHLNMLLRQGESAQRIFSLLLRQFRLVARCKSLAVDHEYRSIASELQVPPFVVGKCLQQARRFSSERLRSAFGEFSRAQMELHSSKYLPEAEYQAHILELLVTRIVG